MDDRFLRVRAVRAGGVVACICGALLLAAVGCRSAGVAAPMGPGSSPANGEKPGESAKQPKTYQPAAAGAPLDPQQKRANDLLKEMSLGEQSRKAASKAATDEARKLVNDLRYSDAEEKLQTAVRLDPQNEEAKKLLDRVLFILGDRSGEIRDVARQEFEREKVRREEAKVELERMMVDGRRAMEAGEYDKAAKLFDKVLERIEWFHFNVDLSDIKTMAQENKKKAERLAKEADTKARRQLEKRTLEEAEAEQARSMKYLKNRIAEMMRRAQRAYRNKDFEEAIGLTEQVLELDRSNEEAQRLHRKARELRHLYQVTRTNKRFAEEWDRVFMEQRESGIPYHRIFNFPSRDHWQEISRKTVSLEERIRGRETSEDRNIKAKLQQQRLSIEFPGVPLDQVINTLADISGINFVLTKDALDQLKDKGQPANLAAVKDLPLENILRLVLEQRDPPFKYVIKNGAVVIGPADSLREDIYLEFYEVSDITRSPPDFKAPKLALQESEGGAGAGGGAGGGIFNLNPDEGKAGKVSIGPDVLKDLITKALWGDEGAPEGQSVDYQHHKLVVRTTLANHQKIERLLQALRKSTGVMVTVESRFLDLQQNFLESIGVDIGNPFNTNLPNPIDNIDGAGTQLSSGYEFVNSEGTKDVRATVYNAFSLPLGSQVSPFNISDRGGFALQYNVLDVYILEAILEADAKTQEFRKLDAPRVTAFNTQTAHSLVIDQSAYIKDAEVNQTGVIPVINPVIGVLNAGSILEIRPTVSYDRKYVILEIQPTLAVKLPSRFKNLTLGLTNLEVEFPVLSVTKIKTTVTIPDGGTVLVGGLKRTITQKQQVGLPVLSRLPVLNLLMGRKGRADLESNLFVLINAKITVIRDEEKKEFNP